MDLAKRKNNEVPMQKAIYTALDLLKYGWDKKYGGVFYFKDIEGHHRYNWNGIRNCGGFTLRQ